MRLHRIAWRRVAAALACLLLADFDGSACSPLFLDGQPPEASALISPGATLLCKTDYATFVSLATRDPIWVAEHLPTVQIVSAGMIRRHCRFQPDAELEPGARAELNDYRYSGWDRGHMAPDADMPDDAAQRESCDLANAFPQAPRLNRGIGSVISRTSRPALNDKIRNAQAAAMMSSAIRVALAKRERRREAATVWL